MNCMNNYKRSPSQCRAGGRRTEGGDSACRSDSPFRRPVATGSSAALLYTLGLVLIVGSPARAAVISFVDPQPVVLVDTPVSLNVRIDYGGSGTSALFSYGVTVVGDWEAMGAVPLGAVVPAPLDFNGVAGPGAVIGLDHASIGVKGTVNLAVNPIELYAGSMLAEFQFRFTEPGFYELTLDFFNTLGPTEDIFVNQNGVAIDDSIEFRSGIVQVVIPEPGIPALVLTGVVCLFVRGRRR